MDIILASHNQGKIKEFQQLLKPLDLSIKAAGTLGISTPAEPHNTFLENALAKARHVAELSRQPALADDSGLCVAALAGAPGVHSARYAGERASDAENNAKLLHQLAGKKNRAAYYYCVLVLMRCADDSQPLIAEGMWSGSILESPRGSAGFGYDPIFLDESSGLSAAEMSLSQKQTLSHRGQACRNLVKKLQDLAAAKLPFFTDKD